MRILFLDIDGVLNHTETRHAIHDVNLDRECIANLNYILDNAQDTVVALCSAWRTQETLHNNQKDLIRHGYNYRLHSETPVLRNATLLDYQWRRFKREGILGELDFPVVREFELYAFLDQQLLSDNFDIDSGINLCILDDTCLEPDTLHRYPNYYGKFFVNHCVRTKDAYGGLTKERADKAIELLTGNLLYHHNSQRNTLYDFYKQEEEKDNKIDPTYTKGTGTFECLEQDAYHKVRHLLLHA